MNSLYYTAEEAAAALGISVNSLYAYVSRKRIRTQTATGSKASLYWHEDIDRLAKRGRETASPAADANLVPSTAITLLTKEGPFYRGRSALAMSQTCSIEEVAAHLWQVEYVDVFADEAPPFALAIPALHDRLARLDTIDRFISLLPMFQAENARSHDLDRLGHARSGADIIRRFAAVLVGDRSSSSEPIHQYIVDRMKAPADYADIVRRLLVLVADHELAPATYAVRAAANVGVTPYQAVAVGLNTTRGRRILAGRTYAVRRLIEEIVAAPDPTLPILQRVRAGDPLPGFDGGVYRTVDVRAASLLAALRERFGQEQHVSRLFRALEAARDVAGAEPDVILPCIFVEREIGFPHSDGVLALAGRLVGWVAHAGEQREHASVVRFGAAYSGILPME
ncbi:hypothetical protein HMP09_1949 [Sphingomonas sp. HMP9]|uniref:citrate/2-methylcitrate synthase n=1 Tax=Sphingomonas sp. HMP9 TaxID=1517554 RepID=UPI001596AF30|nr:citrate/2-methylcitrate synthase [Sphingomonas sp. HMP9]BCA62715.1 hypothetical protein HMP09_1949 [Sphingomonas sp. HMP9]